LADELIEGWGTVHASTTVHHHPFGLAVPFAVAEILLDAGPTVRGLLDTPTDDGVRPGDRVGAAVVASGPPSEGTPGELLCFSLREVGASAPAGVGVDAEIEDRAAEQPALRRDARLASTRRLDEHRPVYVVGVGLHRYQRATDTPYVELGLRATRAALGDAGMAWGNVDVAYTATVNLGFAAGRTMLRYLGTTGTAMAQVENASASGSTAFRLACNDVADGAAEVALAVGVDKVALPNLALTKTGLHDLLGGRLMPVTHFALLADHYLQRWGLEPEVLGAVAVKNHRNGAANPFAQRQKVRTLDDVMGEEPLSGTLTRLQCCPVGEGAAAALVASGEAIEALGLDPARAVRVRASVATSERRYPPGRNWDTELTGETVARALREAEVDVNELDVVELHDAFTVEELLYLEAMGLCEPGAAGPLLLEGAWDVGGRCAVSPSGGLLAMGHPLGPTGVGQVAEVATQLRGEAGVRQQPDARLGLAHMVGVGAVCVVHVLEGPG
jgi:acetyl-CoA acetyltransferase